MTKTMVLMEKMTMIDNLMFIKSLYLVFTLKSLSCFYCVIECLNYNGIEIDNNLFRFYFNVGGIDGI